MGLVVGAVALIVALWGVPFTAVLDALSSADPIWLVPAAAVFLVQQTLRALRQWVILSALHPEHTFRRSLSVLCIGFFFVNTLPARLGEVVRPMLLSERDGIPLGSGAAMVVVERAVDLVAMGVMVSVLAWVVPVPGSLGELVPGIDLIGFARRIVGGVVPIVVVSLLALIFAGRPLLHAISRATQRLDGTRLAPLRAAALRFAGPFVDGVAAVGSVGRLSSILALTAVAWSLTGLLYPAIAHATGVGHLIDYSAGMGILGVTMLGMALPAAPGFAGTYEAAVRAALSLYGVAGPDSLVPGGPSLDAIAVAFALVVHSWIHIVQSATAVWFLVVDRVDPREVVRKVWRGTSPSKDAGPT